LLPALPMKRQMGSFFVVVVNNKFFKQKLITKIARSTKSSMLLKLSNGNQINQSPGERKFKPNDRKDEHEENHNENGNCKSFILHNEFDCFLYLFFKACHSFRSL
jgi:hypothetical protein